MNENTKTNLIWACVIAVGILTFGGLVWQGATTSHQAKMACIEANATWISGGHCIQTGGRTGE